MTATDPRPSSLATRRVVIMLAVGAVCAVVTGITSSWWYAGVAGWLAACILYIAWVWVHLWPLDARAMRSHATREDPGIVVSDLLILGASVASLVAVSLVLIRASHLPQPQHGLVSGLALANVALSWFLIHTLYAQGYARSYYAPPEGGIDFATQDDSDPVFSDFAYLALDLGMTYQVSDTTLRSMRLRRLVMWHSLLSYVFGTAILATAINLVV
ncbi:MAG: DUF1345 domain-containing protein [Microbacteriaceae bacterium]|nr:DUF1345 domain-containing protein [Microbacteriaceae bacterium]